MDKGKLSVSILKRSVLKNIRHRRNEVEYKAGAADDCAFISLGEAMLSLSVNPVICYHSNKGFGRLAVYRAINDIAAAGAQPVGILVSLMLPEQTEENYIRLLMQEMEDAVASEEVEIMGGHTEITSAVQYPVIHVTAFGKVLQSEKASEQEKNGYHVRGFLAGCELVLTGFAGSMGAAMIAIDAESELLKHFRRDLLEKAQSFYQECSVVEQMRKVRSILRSFPEESVGLHNAAHGGIFGGLYGISEAARVGFCVDLRKIAIHQETIELCEHFDLNPYMLFTEGSLLIGTSHGTALAEALNEAGINAAVIGYTTEGKDKIVKNGADIRCLDMPGTDELVRYFECR